MLKRGIDGNRENVPTGRVTRKSVSQLAEKQRVSQKAVGIGSSKSTADPTHATRYAKREVHERLTNIASGFWNKNEKNLKGVLTRRIALADKKNVTAETIDDRTKNAEKGRRNGSGMHVSISSKRSQSKLPSTGKNETENRMKNVGKGLAEQLRDSHISEANGDEPCDVGNENLKPKPTLNEKGTLPAIRPYTGKILKPLPFSNGKRDYDDKFNNEVVYCEEYAADSWDYLFSIEDSGTVPPNFLDGSKITTKMRMRTLDWITGVQTTFKLLPETQLTTVNLIDRCLMTHRHTADKKQLQLISLGCAVVAAKYEEIYPPETMEYLISCDNTSQELLQAEIHVLRLLECKLNYPRAIQFIRRLTEHYDLTVHTLAKTIGEIASYDYNTCHMKPSIIAAVAVYIAATLEGVEFPDKLHEMARVSKAEAERLAPVFARAIMDLIKAGKYYEFIYRRLFAHKRMIFTKEHRDYLGVLAARAH